jgi:hypothetical protein
MKSGAPRQKNNQDAQLTRLFYFKSLRIFGTYIKTAVKFWKLNWRLSIIALNPTPELPQTNEQPILFDMFNIWSIRE